MRNLKRALSLTLASVMLLGMMVVGTSAKGYDDVDADDNVEAIEVLQAVEVMVGDDRGFGPDRPVTRNEMAVVMGKLLNLNYNYYVSTCPFTDVAEWARGWVGACYANGIVSGRGDGIYDGEATVTAVEAASMMMRALGYFKYTEDYADGFNVVTVRQGSEIGIFNDVGTDADTPMTRNQVAQMALNALKANMVAFTGTPGIEVNGVKVGYKAEYTPRTSPDGKYAAIGKLVSDIGRNDQYYIQLGEELYDGDLRLNDTTDDFGRPARYWEYDGTAIGTYAKKELIQETYTAKVTGKTLYDLLGKDLVNLINGDDPRTSYTLSVTVDGNDDNATHTKVFGKSALTRTNTDAVGGTGNGVLTEVYVDNTARSIDIAIINTYLAIADNDYNEKKDEVSLRVYNLDKDGSLYFKDYKRDSDGDSDSWRNAENVLKASGEDFNVADVKKDDKLLVTVANGEIKSVVAPEIVSDQTITSHKTHDYVVADKQYDYATTAQYDDEVMDSFSSVDMKDVTYNVVLDKYGYLIGLEQNEKVDEYVFLTGIDDAYSYLSKKNVPANIIHLDGTMETVTMNAKDSTDFGDVFSISADEFAQVHTWCTYSVDNNNIYTLKKVADVTSNGSPKVKVAQSAMDADSTVDGNGDSEIKINSKNISLDGDKDTANLSYVPVIGKVHGNDNTVYINVEMENVRVDSTAYRRIVKDVDSVTTGVTNVDMTVKNRTKAVEGQNSSGVATFDVADNEVYTLFKDNGTIIAVVTLEAEDNASTKHYAYISSSDIKHRDYDGSTKEYSWYREAIVDGEFVMLKEVDDDTASDYINNDVMERGAWYEIKYNADGEVRGITKVAYATASGSAPSGKDYPRNTAGTTTSVLGTTINTIQIGISYIQDCNYVANMIDDTFILNADFTGNHPELKYNAGTLYTGTDTTKGVYVSPTAKVVVYTKNYDKHEEYTGAEMEKALNALVNKKAFDGYVNAVIGDNGIATVVILDEKNMDAPDTYSITFTGATSRVTFADGTALASITGIAKGDSRSFALKAKTGSVLNGITVDGVPQTPDANGKYTINNITDDVTVNINAEKDGDAYDGTIVVDISDPADTAAEWTGTAKPTYDEMYNAVLEKLLGAKYDRNGLTDLSDGSSSISFKATKRNDMTLGTAITFTLDYDGDLTEIREVSTQDALTAALSDAGFTGKIKLTSNATVTAAPAKDIEVAAGSTLTLNGSMALTEDITGAGNVTIGGSGAITDGGENIKVSGKTTVEASGTVNNLTGITGDVEVKNTLAIAEGMALAANKTLTIADGKTLTLTVASTLDGSVTGGATGSALILSAGGSVNNIDNKVSLTNTTGALAINGTATPKALTQNGGKITVAATGNLTLPATTTAVHADGLEIVGTVKLSGDLAVNGSAKNIDIKATGILDLNGKALTGATNATIGVAAGAKINNISGAKFFDLTNAAVTENITVPSTGVSTYNYGTNYGANTDETGWKATA